jgi:hypothetical protein
MLHIEKAEYCSDYKNKLYTILKSGLRKVFVLQQIAKK